MEAINSSTDKMSAFNYKLDCKPDYSFLTVKVPAGRTIKVEASSMASMDTNMKMKTKMAGGLGRLFTGESLFINEFTAENAAGEICIAPNYPGDIDHVNLQEGNVIFLQNSAFVACDPSVKVESKFQGLVKGFFSGENLFLVKCTGPGDLWFNSYGGILQIDVTDGYIVDTGHIVAFTEGLDYDVSRIGGYKSLFFSGEGLVCRFKGQGKVWIQTHKITPLTSWVRPFRPQK
jgi:uncharacterized protein (TIGR00266 family)